MGLSSDRKRRIVLLAVAAIAIALIVAFAIFYRSRVQSPARNDVNQEMQSQEDNSYTSSQDDAIASTTESETMDIESGWDDGLSDAQSADIEDDGSVEQDNQQYGTQGEAAHISRYTEDRPRPDIPEAYAHLSDKARDVVMTLRNYDSDGFDRAAWESTMLSKFNQGKIDDDKRGMNYLLWETSEDFMSAMSSASGIRNAVESVDRLWYSQSTYNGNNTDAVSVTVTEYTQSSFPEQGDSAYEGGEYKASSMYVVHFDYDGDVVAVIRESSEPI